jgi:hypothetical protein
MDSKPPTLRDIANEIGREDYLQRALQRARRRKSPWNLLLIPLGFGFMGLVASALFRGMWFVHTMLYPQHVDRLHEFWARGIGLQAFASSFLLLMPLLIAAIPVGMLLANGVLWCIPPARKALDREAEGIEWASFPQSMASLGRISLVVAPVCLLLSLVGAATLGSLR